jgi:hypothetical protein
MLVEFTQVSQVAKDKRPDWLSRTDPIEQYVLFRVVENARGWVDRLGEDSLRISGKGVSSLSPEKVKNPLKNYAFIKTLGNPNGGAYGKVGLYHKIDSTGKAECDQAGCPKQFAIKTGAFKDGDLYGGNVTELKALIATLNHSGTVVEIKKATISDGQINFFLELLEPFEGTLEQWEQIAPNPILNANFSVSDRKPDNTAFRGSTPVHIDLGQPGHFDEFGVRTDLRKQAIEFGVKNVDRLDDLLPKIYPSGLNDYIERDLTKAVDELREEILSQARV